MVKGSRGDVSPRATADIVIVAAFRVHSDGDDCLQCAISTTCLAFVVVLTVSPCLGKADCVMRR